MKIPTWLKPGLMGAVVGAIVLAIIGFNWGGWVTAGTAKEMADTQSVSAVTASQVPYCVARAKADPNSAAQMEALKAASSYERSDIVSKAGWATAPGSDSANSAVARACEIELMKTTAS